MVFLGREVHEQRDYSDQTALRIDEEVSALLKRAQATALRIIKENRDKLESIVATLLEKETLEREDFEALMNNPAAS